MYILVLIEILKSAALAFVPLFIFAFLLIRWMRKSQVFGDLEESKSFKEALKKVKKARKKDKTKQLKKQNRLVDKWFYFGGGFYGLMALSTYFHIEVLEVFEFIGKVFQISLSQIFSSIGFELLVSLVVNAFVNLIKAFFWFSYWPQIINTSEPLIWFLMAYAGYWLGAKYALIVDVDYISLRIQAIRKFVEKRFRKD
jgi:hypothetical protein